MSTAWKAFERRICRLLGGQRRGPALGQPCSDCVDTPFAAEIKRSSRPGPPVLSSWVAQARAHGKRERKPWLVVVAGHYDRRPIACLDLAVFLELGRLAGVIVPATSDSTLTVDAPTSREEQSNE